MNKAIKILSALIMVVMITTAMSTVFATALEPSSMDSAIDYSTDVGKIKTTAGKIIGAIRNVAAIAAVVIISIFGIKFMIGSTEERAEYKKSFIPLIIGIIVVLGASTIANWIWGVAK